MVNIYLLNPAHKLRFLSRLIMNGSRRMLGSSLPPPATVIVGQDIELQSSRWSSGKADRCYVVKKDLPRVPTERLKRDPDYYEEQSASGFCVFRVEDTLFKIHRCFLLREPSAFTDMFSFPRAPGSLEGLVDQHPIPLTDTIEHFRDLMWVLYAVPSQLCAMDDSTAPPLARLINIAEICNKYCIGSYESWALDRICSQARNPNGFLQNAPPALCARVLNVAAISNRYELIEILTQRLSSRILWSDMDRAPILKVAESRGISKLQGVIYYRDLVDWEKAAMHSALSSPKDHSAYLPQIDAQKRSRFLTAYNSLVNLWDFIHLNPPSFTCTGCNTHSRCLDAWSQLWLDAGASQQTLRHGSADVLSKLKSMMIQLKKAAPSAHGMSVGCALAALEAITTTRDDVITGLINHFRED